jgi:thiol-disulfide isomerase/thioredoxin
MKIFYGLMISILLLGLTLSPVAVPAQSNTNLTFKKLDGGALNLSDLRGQVLVISFSAKGIPLTRFELPQLDRLASKFAGRGVSVIWVSCNSNRPKSQNFASDDELRALAAQYPNLIVVRDSDESASRQMGVDSLPTIVNIDQKGRMVGSPRTGIDPQANLVNDLTPTINQLLSAR